MGRSSSDRRPGADGASRSAGRLAIVATPIGNLDDICPRATAALREATAIAAEDTRRTGRLLSHFGLKTPLIALHEHNESDVSPGLIAQLENGASLALVSDAGTPLISDPGYRLVSAAIDAGIAVTAIPGPTAAIVALSLSGLPSDRFLFAGFAPQKAAARDTFLAGLAGVRATLILFESVHRLGASLSAMASVLGPRRRAAVCRELTKRHETVHRGRLADLAEAAADGQITLRGEFVIVVEGPAAESRDESETLDRLLVALLEELPVKRAVAIAARALDQPRNAIYRRALELSADG